MRLDQRYTIGSHACHWITCNPSKSRESYYMHCKSPQTRPPKNRPKPKPSTRAKFSHAQDPSILGAPAERVSQCNKGQDAVQTTFILFSGSVRSRGFRCCIVLHNFLVLVLWPALPSDGITEGGARGGRLKCQQRVGVESDASRRVCGSAHVLLTTTHLHHTSS
jgi:hypothetical protein